ncbi:MAG: response regulator transcription factor [Bradyrhizobium sp.]|nr:response regulator transcription factor [Bradyrhizobium sp.]
MPWNATSRGETKGEIFILDNDAAMRETLARTLEQRGYDVISFADGASLLAHAKAHMPLCIFLEVGTTDRSGIDLLKRLRAENCPAPVFVTSATGAISMAVDAVRNGAFDFIVKPFCEREIARRVEAAIDEYSRPAVSGHAADASLFIPGGQPLTSREREVLARIAVGETNKEAARRLGLSARTIEGYRASIMRKVGARNAAELLRRVFSQAAKSKLQA